MKTTFYSFLFLIGSLFLFTQCEKEKEQELPDGVSHLKSDHLVVQELWAGAGKNDLSKGTLVGYVTAERTGEDEVTISYSIEDGWVISLAHVWVGNEITGIPKNAAPGLFPFHKWEAPFEFVIPLSENDIDAEQELYVAAHADVCIAEGVPEYSLPEAVCYTVNFNGESSYLNSIVIGNSPLAGEYNAWCIELDQDIYPNTEYCGTVLSSLYDIPEGTLEKPENLDLVNYLLNQDIIGYPSVACGGNYTWSDLQAALWTLLINEPEIRGLGEYSECRVAELVSNAMDNGEGFEPDCGEKYALLFLNDEVQDIIIEIPKPCCETAWAWGMYSFIDNKIAKKWGWIFSL